MKKEKQNQANYLLLIVYALSVVILLPMVWFNLLFFSNGGVVFIVFLLAILSFAFYSIMKKNLKYFALFTTASYLGVYAFNALLLKSAAFSNPIIDKIDCGFSCSPIGVGNFLFILIVPMLIIPSILVVKIDAKYKIAFLLTLLGVTVALIFIPRI